jgi:hypothetical protein
VGKFMNGSGASQEPERGTQAISTTGPARQSHPAVRPTSEPGIEAHRIGSEAWERDQMLDRLRSLRRVLPALAQEMAAARRQAARLRTDNRRLSEQVRQLRAALDAREHKPA